MYSIVRLHVANNKIVENLTIFRTKFHIVRKKVCHYFLLPNFYLQLLPLKSFCLPKKKYCDRQDPN